MKKLYYIIILLFTLTMGLLVQAQERKHIDQLAQLINNDDSKSHVLANEHTKSATEWIWVYGSGSSQRDKGNSIFIDNDGYIYVVGEFKGQIVFGSTVLTNDYSRGDMFLVKYDQDHNVIFAKQTTGNNGRAGGKAIVVDIYGNMYITGSVKGYLDFGNGVTINANTVDEDIFITKYNSNGVALWCNHIGNNEYYNSGFGITIDNDNYIYVTGTFAGNNVNFGNGFYLTSNISTIWGYWRNVFIAKYNSNGICQWANSKLYNENVYGYSISLGVNNDVYISSGQSIAEKFNATTGIEIWNISGFGDGLFCSGNKVHTYTSGNYVCYTDEGVLINEKNLGTLGGNILVDSQNNIYIEGEFMGTIDIDGFQITSNGDYDIFSVKLNANLITEWITSAGGNEADFVNSFALHPDNIIYSTGSFRNNAIFGDYSLVSNGVEDFFIASQDNLSLNPPSANFNGAPTSIEEGQSVTFTNASTQGTNPITSWTWTFEGGNPGTYYGQNPPVVVYNTAGTYDVTLVVSDGSLSDTAVKTDYITVNPAIPPTAEFNGTPLNGDAPLNVSFTDLSVAGTNAITSWSWDFGDGGSSSSQNPSHPYNTPGTYTVSLTVSDGSLYDEETKTDYITVTQPAPVADFSGTPLSGDAPLIVNFTDLSANNPDSWSWDFGDGESSSSQNPNHIYDVPGTYSVSLTVSNSGGSDTETKTDYISVSAAPPKANFSGTPTTGFVPLEVSFTDQSIAGTYAITSREWDFCDGSTSTDQNPSHTYNSAGDYTVSLTVSDGTLEDTEIKSNYISVSPVGSPVANFSADPTWGSGTLTTQFTDESVQGTYPITIWSWNFGDGGSSSSQNPEHTYSSPGSYTVSLTVSDGDLSDIKTKTDYIHVYEFLTVNAGPDQALEMGLSTQLDGSYSGGSGNIEINWEGVGNNVPISNPNILNPNVGPFIDIDAYYFSLSVEDLITGETQSDEMMVDVLLGLNENLTSRIGVYPNPTNGKLWIKSEEAQSIRISDALGIEILQVKTTEETTVIDLSTYPDGVYLVQIFMKDELKIFKVIKK